MLLVCFCLFMLDLSAQYFGELALLSQDIGSRRTAYVRAVGYAEVFVMHKEDIASILESDSSLRTNLANRASKLLGDLTVHDATATAASRPGPSPAPRGSFALVTPEYSKRKRSSVMPPPLPRPETLNDDLDRT